MLVRQKLYSLLFTVYSQSAVIKKFKGGTLTRVLNYSALMREGRGGRIQRFQPDGKWFATIERSAKAHVWNVEAPNEPAIISTQNAEAMVFSPDSATLAIVSRKGIYLWKFRIEAEEVPNRIDGNLGGF